MSGRIVGTWRQGKRRGGAPEHVHDDVSFFHFLTSFMKRATACNGFVDLENYPRDS